MPVVNCQSLRSETRVNGFFSPANFALHLAAPMEGARAAFDHLLHFGLVTAAAAHEVAAVDADRRLVADTTLRPGDAQFQVLLAEVGRILIVDQVLP